MRSNEREEFDKHVATLLAGFDRTATPERKDAYWRGCMRMPLSLFERAVDRALSDRGADKLPTPKGMWSIADELRSSATSKPAGAPKSGAELVECFAGSLMFAILLGGDGRSGKLVKPAEKGRLGENGRPASDAALRAMLKVKRDIIASAVADDVTARAFETPVARRTPEQVMAIGELKEVLLAAFEKAWKPRTAEETAADLEHVARTGYVRGAVPEQVRAALESAA